MQCSGHVSHRIYNYNMNISASGRACAEVMQKREKRAFSRGTNTSSIWQALGAARSPRKHLAWSVRRLPPAYLEELWLKHRC